MEDRELSIDELNIVSGGDCSQGAFGGIAWVTCGDSSAIAWSDGHGGTYSMATGGVGVTHKPA